MVGNATGSVGAAAPSQRFASAGAFARRNLVGIRGADGVEHAVRRKAFPLLAIGVGGGI